MATFNSINDKQILELCPLAGIVHDLLQPC